MRMWAGTWVVLFAVPGDVGEVILINDCHDGQLGVTLSDVSLNVQRLIDVGGWANCPDAVYEFLICISC